MIKQQVANTPDLVVLRGLLLGGGGHVAAERLQLAAHEGVAPVHVDGNAGDDKQREEGAQREGEQEVLGAVIAYLVDRDVRLQHTDSKWLDAKIDICMIYL